MMMTNSIHSKYLLHIRFMWSCYNLMYTHAENFERTLILAMFRLKGIVSVHNKSSRVNRSLASAHRRLHTEQYAIVA